jgi:uncharacterized protein
VAGIDFLKVKEITCMPYELLVEKDVAIKMNDGNVLRANIYRPKAEGRFPVVMTHGVYGKDVHFADAFAPQWKRLHEIYPGMSSDGSTGQHLRWEVADPDRWVPDGYIIVTVDARGTGKSPGYLDPRSPRELQDFYDCVEWAAAQPWCNGKVGLLGISYYAFTQWGVAALRPPHLAAIIPWEGFTDFYRDSSHHGGIFANVFTSAWWPRQVLVNQHGNAETHHRDRETGERTTGPATYSADQLAGNRADYVGDLSRHHLDDAWYKERSPDLSRIDLPVLSAGNWGGPGVHLRGNIEGYMRIASTQKWLSMHVGTHFESFYLPKYVAMQKKFFDHYLKDIANGWDKEPPVQLAIRRPGGADIRMESEFPLKRTRWTKFHLDADSRNVGTAEAAKPSQIEYQALSEGVTFTSAPFETDTEFTGFVSARLWIASATTDMDVFATIRAFAPDGTEVLFEGAHENVPVTLGWLRASRRKLDPARTLPYRPYHSHDEVQKLTPGEFYPLDLEFCPTSMIYPKGYRLAVTFQGQDFAHPQILGRIRHNDPLDRDPAEFGGTNFIATGGDRDSYLLLPLVPPR